MSMQTEKSPGTRWNLAESGSAIVGGAGRLRSRLAEHLPEMTQLVSLGAGLALARRGTRAAVASVRRHPLATLVGAVTVLGVGLAIALKRRQGSREANDGAERARLRRDATVHARVNRPRAAAKKTTARATRVRAEKRTSH